MNRKGETLSFHLTFILKTVNNLNQLLTMALMRNYTLQMSKQLFLEWGKIYLSVIFSLSIKQNFWKTKSDEQNTPTH